MDGFKMKKKLEREAIHGFISIYNVNHPIPLRLLYLQEKPDAVLEDTQRRKLGMEITHLYYNQAEAQLLLNGEDTGQAAEPSLLHWVAALNERIYVKEQKKRDYSQAYPVSLLIRNVSPLFGMSDVLRVKDSIRKPKETFVDVWLLSKDGSDEWLLYNLDNLLPWNAKETWI